MYIRQGLNIMKIIIYEYEKMVRAGQLLNSLEVSGSSNFRALAELANILDSGKIGETFEKEAGKNGNMERKAVQQDQLEKQAVNDNPIRPNKSKQG